VQGIMRKIVLLLGVLLVVGVSLAQS